jgi:hypothetical protein
LGWGSGECRGRTRSVCVDEERALDALRLAWGEFYDIGHERGVWVATRSDGTGLTLSGGTPDVLDNAIRADWTRRQAGGRFCHSRN